MGDGWWVEKCEGDKSEQLYNIDLVWPINIYPSTNYRWSFVFGSSDQKNWELLLSFLLFLLLLLLLTHRQCDTEVIDFAWNKKSWSLAVLPRV